MKEGFKIEDNCKDNPWALYMLTETLGILGELGLKARPSFGTLLGLYRDGKLIDHDTDMDLIAYVENECDVVALKESIKLKMTSHDYELVLEDNNQVVFTKYGTLPVDICIFKQYAEVYLCPHMCGVFEVPVETADNPEVFFKKIYGDDWMTPRKDGKHSERAWLHGDGVRKE
jgi:hypothetical protein